MGRNIKKIYFKLLYDNHKTYVSERRWRRYRNYVSKFCKVYRVVLLGQEVCYDAQRYGRIV